MKPSAAVLVLSLALAGPLWAEDPAPKPEPKPEDDGFSLVEEGAKLMLRGLMSEMEPTLKDMDKALNDLAPMMQELAPRMRELITLLGDMQNYQAPEVLPNGDILIRRKVPLVPRIGPQLPGKDGAIDL